MNRFNKTDQHTYAWDSLIKSHKKTCMSKEFVTVTMLNINSQTPRQLNEKYGGS